jgi:1-acyl-sn-glycerol-3-phosphate acyltransferase
MDLTTPAIVALVYAAAALGYSWWLLPRLERRMETGAVDGFAAYLVGGWLRLVHRPTWVGFDDVRETLEGSSAGTRRGAILIANHASGVDPFVLQLPWRRRIRWMMAEDQMLRGFEEVWKHLEVLPVTYGPGDAAIVREALRHVQSGGLLGIFPEAGIARPPRQLRPFLAGTSLLVARAKVPVVVCWIDGAPNASSAAASLVTPSRIVVRCLGVVDFRGERDVEAIGKHLRGMIAKASGWPLNDEPLPGTGGGRPKRTSARERRSSEAGRGDPVGSDA